MSEDIVFSASATRAQIAELETEATKIKQLLADETAVVGQILSSWSGTGSDAFKQRYTEWTREADELSVALDRLSDTVHHGADTMAATESDVGGMFD